MVRSLASLRSERARRISLACAVLACGLVALGLSSGRGRSPLGLTLSMADTIVLKNANGTEAGIMPLGAAIQFLSVADRGGKVADVVLGFDDEQPYLVSPVQAGGGSWPGRAWPAQARIPWSR